MTQTGSFIRHDALAIFLDVDGTLLDIAPTPDAVHIPAALTDTLDLAAACEHGALALVSGRSIDELDRFFAPRRFPAAGQHGLERRDAKGILAHPPIAVDMLKMAREALRELESRYKGLLLEDKGTALAIHYRQAPDCESVVRKFVAVIAEPLAPRFLVRSGKCVLEITPSGYSKRTAIESFMGEQPFAGRTPLFIGDDVTDEDGFDAVNRLGGYSIRVGSTEHSKARYSFASVATVIGWLEARYRRASCAVPRT